MRAVRASIAGFLMAAGASTQSAVSTAPRMTLATTDTAPTTQPGDDSAPASEPIEPTAVISIGLHVDGGLVTEDAVWASVDADDTLYRIDPATNTVVGEVDAPGLAFRFAIGHDAAWVPDFEASIVRRIDLASGEVTAEIATGPNPEGVLATDDAVWVADHRGGTVSRIDPVTNTVVATVEVGPAGPAGPVGLVATDDRIWVGVPNLGQVVGIDPLTNGAVDFVDSSATCGELAALEATVWVTNCFESSTVEAIDSVRGVSRGSIDTGDIAGTPLPIGTLVWVSTLPPVEGDPGRFLGIDPQTLEIVDTITVGDAAYIAGQGFGSVWQFSWSAGAVIRLPLDPFQLAP